MRVLLGFLSLAAFSITRTVPLPQSLFGSDLFGSDLFTSETTAVGMASLAGSEGAASGCEEDAVTGIFEPRCFADSGRGDTLISQWDAAFNAAAAFVTSEAQNPRHLGATVRWNGEYSVCNAQHGIVLPQNSGAEGGPGVDLVGGGPSARLSVTCRIDRKTLPQGAQPGSPGSNAVIWMPVEAHATYTRYNWHDFTLWVNGRGTGCMDIEGLVHVSQFTNIVMGGARGDGSTMSNCMRWGNSKYEQSTANQVELHNIGIIPGGNGGGSDFVATTALNAGVPEATVVGGGQNYSPNAYLYLVGPPSTLDPVTGVSSPCRTMGSISATISGGVIASPQLKDFADCAPGTTLRAFDPVFPVNYGVWLDSFTDSQYTQINAQQGQLAAIYAGSRTGNNHYQSVHTCCLMPTGFIELGQGDSFVAFYADGPGQRAMSFGRKASASLQQSKLYWNAVAKMNSTQAGAYSFAPDVGPVTISGGTCNITGLQTHGGYAHVVSPDGADRYPANLVIVADMDCSSNKQIMHLP